MTPNLQPILFRGRLAAAASTSRFFLASHLDALEDDHPDRFFVSVMCLHAREVLTGRAPGPYADAEAERATRQALMPDDDFCASWSSDDADLAERFIVPLDQVRAKRLDIQRQAART